MRLHAEPVYLSPSRSSGHYPAGPEAPSSHGSAVASYHRATWQVTFSGGAIETFPNSDWQKVRVKDDIAA